MHELHLRSDGIRHPHGHEHEREQHLLELGECSRPATTLHPRTNRTSTARDGHVHQNVQHLHTGLQSPLLLGHHGARSVVADYGKAARNGFR